MKKNDDPTLHDKIVNRFKNTPWIARFLTFSLIVAGAATFFTDIDTLRNLFKPVENPAPKVRIQYYTIGGHAISLLLVGALDPTLQKHLGGKPVVWQNKIYDELLTLHNIYARQGLEVTDFESKGFSEEELAAFKRTTKLIPFSKHVSQTLALDESAFDVPEIGNPLQAPNWKVSFAKDTTTTEIIEDFKDGKIPLTRLIFSKRLSCQDATSAFENLGVSIAPFLKTAGANACTNLTFDIIAEYFDDQCYSSEHWVVTTYIPGLSIDLAVIQNISSEAIKIDSITFNINKISGIGPIDSSQKKPDIEGTVGDGTLLTNDRLIIPLSLRFSNEFKDSDYYDPPATYKTTEIGIDHLKSLIATYPNIELMPPQPFPESMISPSLAQQKNITPATDAIVSSAIKAKQDTALALIPSEKLITNYGFTPTEEHDNLPYTGTILSPKSIVVNGIPQKVKGIQLGGLYISDTFTGGSCPYLYAEKADGTMLALGKILVGHDAIEKDSEDTQHIPTWPSKILIKELDPETTYLRSAKLICETFSGETFSQPPIESAEGILKTIILKQGEEASLSFTPLRDGIVCKSVFAKIGGYYIPDNPSSPTRKLTLLHYISTPADKSDAFQPPK